jgi:hypothetical protein
MATVKKGKITYNKKTPPDTLTYKQVDMANKVAKEIVKIGIDAKIVYSSGTIDIEILADGSGKSTGFNNGIFRIFWSRDGNNKIQYLGVGIGYYDGYEIKRGWSNDIEIKDVKSILKKDIAYYNSRKRK